MRRSELERLRRIASQREPPMTRVALYDIGNPESVQRDLQAEFEKSLRGKESTEKLIQRLQRITDMSRERAATIAQTERTRAANSARVQGALDEYLTAYDKAVQGHRKRPERPEFQWVNPLVARMPRHEHVALSGTVRPVGEEFLPNLHYPGDPQAPARQTVNCHCYVRRVR